MGDAPRHAGAGGRATPGDGTRGLRLEWEAGELAVCRLDAGCRVPAWASDAAFSCLARTDHELSMVVPMRSLPPLGQRPRGLRVEGPWRALRVAGTLGFDLVGLVVSLCGPLADAGIPVFVLSTFDTDYVLVRSERAAEAVAALRGAGHTIALPP